jgi:hypothetical protein
MDLNIVAYKLPNNLWAFDYEPNNTVEELLMNGTEEVIDSYYYFIVGEDANPGDKIKIYLSDKEISDWDTILSIECGDEQGTTYSDAVMCSNVWLCKWLDNYFGHLPETIWVRITPINEGLIGFEERTRKTIQNYFSKNVFNKNYEYQNN